MQPPQKLLSRSASPVGVRVTSHMTLLLSHIITNNAVQKTTRSIATTSAGREDTAQYERSFQARKSSWGVSAPTRGRDRPEHVTPRGRQTAGTGARAVTVSAAARASISAAARAARVRGEAPWAPIKAPRAPPHPKRPGCSARSGGGARQRGPWRREMRFRASCTLTQRTRRKATYFSRSLYKTGLGGGGHGLGLFCRSKKLQRVRFGRPAQGPARRTVRSRGGSLSTRHAIRKRSWCPRPTCGRKCRARRVSIPAV